MKKFVLPAVVIILLIIIGVAIMRSSILKKTSAGLQVNSIPQATVFLDGKQVGQTPYEDTKLKSGEVTLKLVSSSLSWEAKVKLNSGTLALVNREFGLNEETSAGEVITLEPTSNKKSISLAIISQPDSSLIKVDGETKGFAPVNIENLSAGEHEILVSSPDYKERSIRVNFFEGFKSIINVKLASAKNETSLTLEPTATATPSASPTPAKLGAKTTPTPSIKPKTSPTSTTEPTRPYVKILDTPTGWLRVRMEPSTSATESAKVNPGETYPLIDEQTGWYQISYSTNKEGWISSQYAQKFE